MNAPSLQLAALLLTIGTAHAQTFSVELDPGTVERKDAPVSLALRRDTHLPHDLDIDAAWSASVSRGDAALPAQVEPYQGDGRLAGGLIVRWVEPELAAGESVRAELSLSPRSAPDDGSNADFHFRRDVDRLELLHGERLVWRHETAWDPERYEETYKPFHHLGDFHGDTVLTKGSGGLYGHHRGLFLGWSKTTVGGTSTDFWHMPGSGGAYQRHVEYLAHREHAGPVFARSASTTRWVTGKGDEVVEDVRDLLVWRIDDGWLLDVAIEVRSLGRAVVLDGDPAHAGFQFRAAQTVAEAESCEYLRPESATGGENDNWEECPWVAGRFPIGERRYEVLFLDHPSNPRPVFNTRAYGRFGLFPKGEIEADGSIYLKYRLRVREVTGEDEASVAQLERVYRDYVEPVRARVVE